MALDRVTLDDLDWKGMVEAIRRRIPAASDGQWTLHAPVDPGVTLLELFAWQLEQRLFRMDQVPDPLNRALLAVLGTRPRRTRCATTVFQLQPGAAAGVPRGAEFVLDGSTPPLTFSTRAALSVLPVSGVRVWVGDDERTADLRADRVFRLFPSDGTAAEWRVGLEMAGPPAPGGWFGLWLDLRGPVAPQGSPNAAAGVPPPAVLSWWYRSGDGREQPFAVDDGTGGLRRSGIVRLRVPADWAAEGGAWVIRVRCDRTSFSAPPRLAALAANAVSMRHARLGRAIAPATEWLPLPGNTIPLEDQPLPTACRLCLKERDGQWHTWWPVVSLQACGPADRRFVVDRTQAQLRFGDGLNGRLPVLADGTTDGHVGLRYRVGGGAAGAVGRTPDSGPAWTGPDGCIALNLTENVGGIDAEAIDDARERAAAALVRPTRAVTRDDFEAIALATPGVAVRRAHAAIGRHPSMPCSAVPGAVTVVVVPDVPREDLDPDRVEDAFVAAPVPDPGLLGAVRAELDRARLVCTELFVRGPRYRAVRLRAVLRGDIGDPLALQQSVRDALARFLDPLTGGEDGTGWPFGAPVRAAVMLREVQAAAGPKLRVDRVAVGLDGDAPDESCRAVEIGPDDLVWLQDVALQVERTAVANGGLR